RDVLLAYVTKGDDIQVLGSLSVLATLLKTKELDESMLDGLGILPQRKQHKKLLLQALVGESSGEEELFSSKSSLTRDSTGSDIDVYHDKIKVSNSYSSEIIYLF
ncbi:clec16a-like protein, partial [Trifolium pratense]